MMSSTSALPSAHNKPRNTGRYEDFVRKTEIVGVRKQQQEECSLAERNRCAKNPQSRRFLVEEHVRDIVVGIDVALTKIVLIH